MPKLKIELKSVAKQVARAMLHVFLLQRVENDSTFYLHEGELHIKTCVQLAAFFFSGRQVARTIVTCNSTFTSAFVFVLSRFLRYNRSESTMN